MEFRLALLAVKDVEVSKKFYGELFDQKVIYDFGINVTFSGGFAIQQNFEWLTDVAAESIIRKSNNMELYFEVNDFDEFVKKLEAYPGVKYVHKTKTHDWGQRVVRIYDPDYHMIEVGEAMSVVVKKYLAEGNSIEKTVEITQHPIEFVKMCMEEMLANT